MFALFLSVAFAETGEPYGSHWSYPSGDVPEALECVRLDLGASDVEGSSYSLEVDNRCEFSVVVREPDCETPEQEGCAHLEVAAMESGEEDSSAIVGQEGLLSVTYFDPAVPEVTAEVAWDYWFNHSYFEPYDTGRLGWGRCGCTSSESRVMLGSLWLGLVGLVGLVVVRRRG